MLVPESVRQGILGTSEACGKGVQIRGKGKSFLFECNFKSCYSYKLFIVFAFEEVVILLDWIIYIYQYLSLSLVLVCADIILSFSHNQAVHLRTTAV